MSEASVSPPAFLQRLGARLLPLAESRRVMIALTVVAFLSCLLTGVVMTQRGASNINAGYWLLNIDLIVLLLLGTVIAYKIVGVWAKRRSGIAGSRLHTRLVLVFSVIATVPAILMVIFSSMFLYFGVHAWFNEHVSTAVNEARAVAQAYLKEHQQVMRADVLAMAADLNRQALELQSNPAIFSKIVDTQSMLRNLSEAIVFRSDGTVIARSRLSFTLELDWPSSKSLEQAAGGDEVVLMTSDSSDRIRGLVQLDRFLDAYLYVGRLVDAGVLQHMQTTQKAVDAYNLLEQRQSQMQILATGTFMAVSLLLLLAAVWFGLAFSEQLVAPVSALILAAERVRRGDLSVRVAEPTSEDEIALLGRAFNRMTRQIESQQEELLAANRMLDERRRFTEAILAGASSGVVGLGFNGVVTLANAMSGELLLGDTGGALTGRKLTDFLPEAEEVLQKALSSPEKVWTLQIEYAVGDGPRKTILVRITAERGGQGAVATLDDISALVSAQRKAAWADVARRIAHEIKNPLTPIQLSAERLRRKYLPQIQDDPETFEKCTETIIRQVNDIGHMVGEFSAYARMPLPNKKIENVVEVCQDALILQRQAHPDIGFGFIAADPRMEANCDRAQLTQVITNLLNNAIDSIHERQQQKPGDGRVKVVVEQKGSNLLISVEDNGIGLPEKVRDQLTEPYVTTKKKGSGLGLAIVKKIMEDHEGSVVLEDSLHQDVKSGAKAVIVFPSDVR
jgi:two-component system, NtrC family, nitrogen regulation sensor histidine kinase NtrY